MEFPINYRKFDHKVYYDEKDFDIAKSFSHDLQTELKEFLKAAVFFGSAARSSLEKKKGSDIDILLIIDDLTIILSPEAVEAYRIVVANLAGKHSRKLHVNTLKLTTFWDLVRNGDPIIVNILRHGIALQDQGIFVPMQFMLKQGMIKPSDESVSVYFSRAPSTVINSKAHILQAVVDLYWAVIDAGHSALMFVGELPPPPDQVAEVLEQKVLPLKTITQEHVQTVQELYDLSKQITHREIRYLEGRVYDDYLQKANDFIEHVKTMILKSPRNQT
ncbi:hypothetical protein JW868_04240 [Candidatus Woesearchaeota archaeon]|nr:hypothetical protein [Candidatus Woesearchaeota archaeon]